MGGGVPTRRITEVSGNYSVGKSTLALQVVSKAQEMGMDVLWADTEYQFTTPYAESLGVDCSALQLLQTRFAEDVLDEIEKWATEHRDALIILDSVGNLVVREEAEKTAEGRTIGGLARAIAKFCRKMTPILAENNLALLVLNHQVIDIMSGRIKTSGGTKLEYAKSIWIKLRWTNQNIMKGDEQVGKVIEAEIGKNKLVGTLKQSCELSMIYGQGFNAEQDKLQEMMAAGTITKQGRNFFYQGEKVASSMADAREWIKSLADSK